MPTPDGRCGRQKHVIGRTPAAAAAAFTLSMSICRSFSPRYFTGPTQTTGVIGISVPPTHRLLEVFGVVLRKSRELLLEQNELLVRPRS